MNAVISRCLGLILFSVCFLSLATPLAIAKQPNVLFIFVDDQGYYDLGCYGATEVETPRIDALAKSGVRFTDFYSAAPICSPSRAGLITGCYPRRTGNEVWVHRPDAEGGIPSERLTIAELFKGAGYTTACIGKWHLGFKEEYLPLSQGFDHHYGILHNMDSFEVSHFDDKGGIPFLCDGEVIERGVGADQLTKRYTDEAIAWMEKVSNEGKPFFLYLPHTMLHHPLGVSLEFVGTSKWKNDQEYGDAIQEMDFHTGRLLDTLKRLGIADNTVVVYTSDNGRGPGRNADQPIRGNKLTTFEGGLRVPFIVAGTGVRKGCESTVVAHMMDCYPTLASLAGIRVPEDVILDGRDLSALLVGKTDEIPAFDASVSLNADVPLRRPFRLGYEWSEHFTQEEYLNAFFYHGSQGALAAVRYGPWKLYLNPTLQLFNLDHDPGELNEVKANWPSEAMRESTAPEDVEKVKIWDVKTKLRGMAIRFQEEMH
ncbi:sulfatase-like hydrolase/transferase [Pontiella sulfatireligans]|uniref:Arylsulfatase n=1 Tax=Pontiella sulfatireligans TaxID=2750658 RepID=A0A6C2UHX6_9BACT|nr:sulfatase-like hydrolase/transferase [Pontiella sulfatireligans]SPS74358.1 sulfatase S1_14 [Kiritimatiellales bacterium]VGO19559.1 Arylsulfatase [Pontiella sulfatireligans]